VNALKLFITVTFLIAVNFATGQTVTLSSGGARSLVCPAVKTTTPPPVVKPPASAEVIDFPSDEEIAALHLQQDQKLQSENASPLLSKLNKSPIRIALWGDSHAAARFFSDELVKSFVSNPTAVLPTFIPALMGRLGVRLPVNKTCVGPGWKYDYAYRGNPGVDYTRGLAKMTSSTSDTYIWMDFSPPKSDAKLKSLEVLYALSDMSSQATVALSIDDGPEQEIVLDKSSSGLLKIDADKNFSILKLRLVSGSLNLEGFIPEYNKTASVYFDTFGIPGATAMSWKNINTNYFRAHGFGDSYDLVILEYGTNEGNQRPFNLPLYKEGLKSQMSNLRQMYPDSACILIGPTDRGVFLRRPSKKAKRQAASPQELLTFSKIHQDITLAQKSIGEEFGCSSWSWQDEMGGMGGAYGWLRLSPPLMARDLIHLTVDGYQQSARDFSKSFQLMNLNK
jgi:hypothetical protein